MHTNYASLAVEPGMIFENPIIKDRVSFLETAASTAGKFTLIRVDLAPGGGNPLHCHLHFNETFRAQEGTLGIQVEKRQLMLLPGEEATATRWQRHRFFNPSSTSPISFEVELRPASAGFEQCIAYAYGLATDGRTTAKAEPKHPADMAMLAYWGDTYMSGIVGLVMRVLRGWGGRLIRKGHHRARMERYLTIARERRDAARAQKNLTTTVTSVVTSASLPFNEQQGLRRATALHA